MLSHSIEILLYTIIAMSLCCLLLSFHTVKLNAVEFVCMIDFRSKIIESYYLKFYYDFTYIIYRPTDTLQPLRWPLQRFFWNISVNS